MLLHQCGGVDPTLTALGRHSLSIVVVALTLTAAEHSLCHHLHEAYFLAQTICSDQSFL